MTRESRRPAEDRPAPKIDTPAPIRAERSTRVRMVVQIRAADLPNTPVVPPGASVRVLLAGSGFLGTAELAALAAAVYGAATVEVVGGRSVVAEDVRRFLDARLAEWAVADAQQAERDRAERGERERRLWGEST